jgi:hypothetical protein
VRQHLFRIYLAVVASRCSKRNVFSVERHELCYSNLCRLTQSLKMTAVSWTTDIEFLPGT